MNPLFYKIMVACQDPKCPLTVEPHLINQGPSKWNIASYENRITHYPQAVAMEEEIFSKFVDVSDCTSGTGQHKRVNVSKTIIASYDIKPEVSELNGITCDKLDYHTTAIPRGSVLFFDPDWTEMDK